MNIEDEILRRGKKQTNKHSFGGIVLLFWFSFWGDKSSTQKDTKIKKPSKLRQFLHVYICAGIM